jgi:hypothetical protein
MPLLDGKQLRNGSIDLSKLSGSGTVSIQSGAVLSFLSGSQLTTADANINNGTDVVNKNYVDGVAAGLLPKTPVQVVANTQSLSLSGVGMVIDGWTVSAGDRILVNYQAAGVATASNGIYVATAGSWSRATDSDGTPSNEVQQGNFVFVHEGSTYIHSGWVLAETNASNPQSILVGTESQRWVQFSEQTNIQAGDGLSFTGVNLNVNTGVGLTISFDTVRLTDTTVIPTSYGGAANVATFTVDQQGRLTAASNQLISIPSGQVNNFTASVIALIDGADITGVTAGAGLSGGGTQGFVTLDVNTSNGLSIVNDSVVLGGTLSQSTTIDSYGQDFKIMDSISGSYIKMNSNGFISITSSNGISNTADGGNISNVAEVIINTSNISISNTTSTGNITNTSGNDIINTAYYDIINTASNGIISNTASDGISNTTSNGDISNTSSNDIINTASGDISNTSSNEIINTASNGISNGTSNGDISNTTLNGNISNTSSSDIINTADGDISNTTSNGDISNTTSIGNISNTTSIGNISNTSGSDIINNADNDIINTASNGIISNTASNGISNTTSNGSIINTSSVDIINTASGDISNTSSDIINTASANIINTAEINISNTADFDISNTTSNGDISNTSGGDILNTASNGISNITLGGNITNTSGGDIINDASFGIISNTASSIINTSSGDITNTADGSIYITSNYDKVSLSSFNNGSVSEIKLSSSSPETIPNNGSDNVIIITDDVYNKGMVYSDDYSANFTPESLVSKRYVDSVVTGIGLTAGNGLVNNGGVIDVNIDNGLSIVNDSVVLGGTLSQNTTINNGSFNYLMSSTSGDIINQRVAFGVTHSSIIDSSGSKIRTNTSSGTQLVEVTDGYAQMNVNVAGSQSYIMISNFNIPNADSSTNNRMVVKDDYYFKGLVYDDDYSANFTDNSLVSKIYVDTQVSSGVTAGQGLFKSGSIIGVSYSSVAQVMSGAGLTANGGVFDVGAGAGITVSADTVAVDYTAVAAQLAGNGLSANGTTIDVNVSNGLTIISDTVQVSSSIAGTGLTFSSGVLSVIAGNSQPVYQIGLTTSVATGETGILLSSTPNAYSRIQVFVNGQLQTLGDGVTSRDCHFGTTTSAVALSSLTSGDQLVWNSGNAGFSLSLTDRIDIIYEA